MDKEKDKKQKTVKTDYSSKKRTAAEKWKERLDVKAAEALNSFIKDNIID